MLAAIAWQRASKYLNEFGVRLGTLDNPGWYLSVDLVATELQGRVANGGLREVSDSDWIYYKSDGLKFEAYCGLANLEQALEEFYLFAQGLEPNSSTLPSGVQ